METTLIEKREELQDLADRVRAIVDEMSYAAKLTFIEAKIKVGGEIVSDPLYKKYKYGTGTLISDLAILLGKSKSDIYYCIQAYLLYDKIVSNALETLGKKALSWRKIIELLPSPKEKSLPLPEGKYKVIYADPPWLYAREQHSTTRQNTILASHYPSMHTDEICALSVADLALPDSVLFLWTTSPKLFEAKSVIDAWGFEYKASMVWDKVKHNVGYYVSVRHEFLLIATRGSCLPDHPKLHDSVVSQERGEHSEKPDIFYEIIESMYDGKKIELFARKKREGWDVWGNQIPD